MGHMVHFTIAQASLQVLSAKTYEVMCMQVLTLEHLTYMHVHTGKGIPVRRFADIYAYCRYVIERMWRVFVLILYRKNMPYAKGTT